MGKYCHYYNNGKLCPYFEVGCMFKHEESEKCNFDKQCRFTLCQYKHTANGERLEVIEKQSVQVAVDETDIESDDDGEEYDEDSEDDSLTDNETTDYEKITENELEQNQYNDCGGCSKILSIENS